MRGLLLVAAGGLTREVLQVLRLTGEHARALVLDDDPDRWGQTLDGRRVVGGLDLVTEYDDHGLLVCAGKGATRRLLTERLTALGVDESRYATVVHPRVHVPAGCSIGRGSILLEGVVMTADVQLGEHVVAMPHVTLTHDDVVDDYATLCAGVTLGGGVHVGAAAYLGMRASVRENVRVGGGKPARHGFGAAEGPARGRSVGRCARAPRCGPGWWGAEMRFHRPRPLPVLPERRPVDRGSRSWCPATATGTSCPTPSPAPSTRRASTSTS